MDTRRRRTGPRKPAQVADKPKPKRPIQKDMTVYSRHMRLPQYNGITFTAVAKRDVSFDVRAMAGLPIPSTIDPEAADAYLQTNRDSGTTWDDGAGLLPKPLVQAMRGSRPQPDAYPLNGMATNTDEKPEIIANMEAYAFRGEEDESYWASDEEFNDYALPPPSRWMSGWTAARIAAEGGRANLHRGALSSTGSASAGSGLSSGVTFGQPRGASAGEALGMDGATLDLGLLDRLQAVLPVKRAFMETRYLSLRRQYVGALKEYFLTAEEMGVSLESLREQAAAVRSVLRNGGKAQGITKPEQVAFATDVEESIAVSRVSAAMEAVVRQNAQLRARLATATGRVSGCSTAQPDAEPQTAEEAQAASKPAADLLLVVNSSGCAISGGAKPSAGRRGSGTAQGSQAHADVDMDTGSAAAASKGGNALQLRGRAAARELPQEVLVLGAFHEPVLAVGDLILTPYGRGVVMKQRDLHLLKGEASALPLNAASSSASVSASPSSVHPSPQPSAAAPKGGRKSVAGKAVAGTAGGSITGAAHADSNTASAAGNLLAKPLVQPTTTMVEVLLRFGARASILSSQVVLLAVAGEEYHGPEAADGTLLAAVLTARAKATGRSPVLVGTASSTAYIAKADDILYGPSKPSGASAAVSAGITSAEASTALVGPAVPQAATAKSKSVIGNSLLRGVGTGEGDSSVQAESSWESGVAGRLALHIAAEDGVVLSHKQPVFRVPWDRNTIPRGVPLHIDPLRGTSTLGYIVGTVHSSGTSGPGKGATVQPLHGMTGPTAAEHAGSSHGSHPLASPADVQPHAAASSSSSTSASSALPPLQGGPAGGFGVQSGSVPRPGEATQQVRELFAEVQRLRAQLKQSEESRTEQRKRLTDARVTIARLIEQLNETRSETSELETEITRREKEVGDLQERILELRMRYEPQALAADQAREAEAAARRRERDREDGSSAAAAAASKAMEALVASMSADAADGPAGAGAGGRGLYAFADEDGDGGHSTDGEDDAATTVMGPGGETAVGRQASKSPMKPSSSPAGMRPGMSTSVRKVSSSGGYRGIMSSAAGDGDDSEGEEEGAEGAGGLVAAGAGKGGDDVDVDDAATENTSLDDEVPESDAGALSALIAESDLAEAGDEAILVGALSAGALGAGGPREDASTSSGGALLERAMRGLADADDTQSGAGSGSELGPAPAGSGRGRGRGAAAAARRAVGGASTRTTRTGAVKAGSKRPRSSLEEDGAGGSDAGGDNGEDAEGGTPSQSQEAGTGGEAELAMSQDTAPDGMADNGSSSASASDRGGPVKKARGRPARR